MKQIGVGILGFGTVGAGVADGLLRHREVMAARLGVDIVLRKIADLDITTDRGISVPKEVLTTDASAAIADKGIQIIVETIGGTGIAKKLVLEALNAKKCVVTANKKLLAEYGKEIFETAKAMASTSTSVRQSAAAFRSSAFSARGLRATTSSRSTAS